MNKPKTATGYAYVTPKGEIDVRTVSHTVTAAQLNAMILYMGFVGHAEMTDDSVDWYFTYLMGEGGGTIRKVQITQRNH